MRPRLIVEPHAVYKRVNEGENEIKMNVTVKGGHPQPQVSVMIQPSGADPGFFF